MILSTAWDARMPNSEPPQLHFEQALAELDRILRELEDGTTTLEDGLARYEKGVALIRQCYSQLKNAEQRVQLLSGITADGAADLKAFEHTASFDAAQPPVRRPAPSRKSSLPGITE